MDQNKVLSLLGLAQKAGKIASGEFSTEKSVKSGKAFLVIVAEDASDNTKKMFSNMCGYYKVPVYFVADKETLGHHIGKEFRASLAVNDEGFAKSLMSKLDSLNQEGEM
ncbi:MAG: ribosomal L7Ae/L30e/S12e/Gadd45 family protein [Alistipes sp.]|nr:ribosomal L7Ae/L30e/S12e/Gadd45 family protein [Alistipes sp.]